MKAIVFYVKGYSFKDKDSEKIIEGVSVNYLPTSELEPRSDGEQVKGYIPIKETLPLGAMKKFETVPGVYELEHVMIPSGRGIVQKLYDANFVCGLDGLTF